MSITKVQINRATVGNLSGSRSFTSSSLASRVTTEATNVDNLQTDSGSFSTRVTDLVTASSSFSGSIATLRGAGSLQGVGTSDSPTFAGATITGTLTAQEIHTEFESASVLFSSGSTIFGDTSDDIHRMTGSLNVSGSLTLNDGTLTVTDNVDFNGDLDVDGTTNLDVVDIDGAVDMASTLKAGDTILGQTGNQKGKLTIQSRTGTATRKTNAIVAVPYNDTSESICMIGMDGQSSNNEMHIGSNTSDFMSPTYIDFFTASDVNSQTNSRAMRIQSDQKVGIGTDSATLLLHVNGGALIRNGSDAGSYFDHTNTNTLNFGYDINSNTGGWVNYKGYQGGTTQFRDFYVGNGKGSAIAIFEGSTSRIGIGTDDPDATLDLRGTQKIQTNTVPASIIVGTNDTTDHTGQDSALAIDFRNLSTTNGVAGGIVGLDKDGLELSKILLVTDNHDANTSSIRMFTSTNAAQRTQMVNINNDGVTVGGGASAQRALHVQGTTGLCLSDGDRDRAALLPVSPDADTGHMQFNTRSGGASRERMRLTSTGNLCVGPSGSAAGFYPSLTVTGNQPSMGLRAQDSNSGTFLNFVCSNATTKISGFFPSDHDFRLATTANDGGTSENDRFILSNNGNVSIDGNLTEGSDIRLKTNIEKIPDVLDILDEIKPVKFEWKEDVEEGIEKKHIGLIAQEVEPHFPELIYEGTTRDTEETTYKGLNYPGLTPILLKAVQELSSKVNELQQKIEELEK